MDYYCSPIFSDKINDFVKNYKTTEVAAEELKNFQISALSVLLTSHSINEKQQDLSALAKTHFHHQHFSRRLFADVMQCLSGAFLIIMPIRYFVYGKHPFLTQEKTNRETILHKEILSTMTEDGSVNLT